MLPEEGTVYVRKLRSEWLQGFPKVSASWGETTSNSPVLKYATITLPQSVKISGLPLPQPISLLFPLLFQPVP